MVFNGALGENRTPTSLRTTDFESVASTNSATRAHMSTDVATSVDYSNHTDLKNKINRKMPLTLLKRIFLMNYGVRLGFARGDLLTLRVASWVFLTPSSSNIFLTWRDKR
jgi:hypothetical protein